MSGWVYKSQCPSMCFGVCTLLPVSWNVWNGDCWWKSKVLILQSQEDSFVTLLLMIICLIWVTLYITFKQSTEIVYLSQSVKIQNHIKLPLPIDSIVVSVKFSNKMFFSLLSVFFTFVFWLFNYCDSQFCKQNKQRIRNKTNKG